MEIWEHIKDFEERYMISSQGKVKSLCRRHSLGDQKMKIQTLNNGYQYVKLRKPGVHKKFLIHRLVALHFLPNEDDGRDFVNHKDKDRTNNTLENLEFMTHQENCDHRDGKCWGEDEPF